jgi:hypothetical protein
LRPEKNINIPLNTQYSILKKQVILDIDITVSILPPYSKNKSFWTLTLLSSKYNFNLNSTFCYKM